VRRWNGWGDEAITYYLPETASHYLKAAIGLGTSTPDASFEQVIVSVPTSRLAPHALITTDPGDRVRHARGQSLPDWIATRSGQIETFPDGVAYPNTEEEVRHLLDYAHQTGTHLIPYGGGTSVVGHVNPLSGSNPILTLDLSRLNRLLDLDQTSHLATFEAGVTGPEVEHQLNAQGYTLGHFPQSWELSTLGGWIATRSSGQQSYYYGRMENLFAGGHVETPVGPLDLPPFPASAAGPDLREMILGSEGRLGVITHAVVRIRPLPEMDLFYAAFFRDWSSGVAAVRAVSQSDVPVSMIRLSNPLETETTLALSGRERLVTQTNRILRLLGFGTGQCMLIYGVTGDQAMAISARRRIRAILRSHGGLPAGSIIGEMWRKSRFRMPYMRNTLWELGYAVDTLETAVPWNAVEPITSAIENVFIDGLIEFNERLLVLVHLSHIYRDGASIYVTFIFRRASHPMETLSRWQMLKTVASETIVAHGGTISHQHGIGTDHAPYLMAEKGQVGMSLLEAIQHGLDPQNLLNPGKLLGSN